MTRAEIRNSFRDLCPDVTDAVLSDTACNSILLVGDKEVCGKTRCIVGDYTWTCVAEDQYWDLTAKIPKFYAIDDFPGGGVYYDDDPLDLTTIAQLNNEYPSWKSRASGSPDKYFMRGKTLWVDRKIKTADTVQVYYVSVSDDFNSDDIEPFNQLTYLEPYHNALVLYLIYRAKSLKGKQAEALAAKAEYDSFLQWMRTEINASKKGVRYLRPIV